MEIEVRIPSPEKQTSETAVRQYKIDAVSKESMNESEFDYIPFSREQNS